METNEFLIGFSGIKINPLLKLKKNCEKFIKLQLVITINNKLMHEDICSIDLFLTQIIPYNSIRSFTFIIYPEIEHTTDANRCGKLELYGWLLLLSRPKNNSTDISSQHFIQLLRPYGLWTLHLNSKLLRRLLPKMFSSLHISSRQ